MTKTKWSVDNPTRQPFITQPAVIQPPAASLLTGQVANQVFVDDIKSLKQVQVGEGVKSLASKFGAIGHFRKTP